MNAIWTTSKQLVNKRSVMENKNNQQLSFNEDYSRAKAVLDSFTGIKKFRHPCQFAVLAGASVVIALGLQANLVWSA
jgi:hypothetical protein